MLTQLWAKLTGLFRRPGSDLDGLDFYYPTERLIFTFWDGAKVRKVDPMVYHRRLKDAWPALSADIKAARAEGSKFQATGYEGMVRRSYEVFELAPFRQNEDGTVTGLTEFEVLDLLDQFLAYTGGVKKNWNPSPTSAEETSDSSPSSSDADPLTSSSSASGSTAAVPSSATPSPSPTEPASPLEHCRPEVTILTPSPMDLAKPPSSAASTPPAVPEIDGGGA